MTPFEEQLKQAMARREPAEDFARRVLERADREGGQQAESGGRRVGGKRVWFSALSGWFHSPRVLRFSAAAALLAVSGGVVFQQHEQSERGEAAKEKLLTAVRIAGVKLRQVHRHVLEVETPEVEQ